MQPNFAQRKLEERMIRQALVNTQGDIARAAINLRLSRRSLMQKMAEYNLRRKDFLPKKKEKR